MNEKFEANKGLDTKLKTFEDLSDDDWDGLVNRGIPLVSELQEVGDERAGEVIQRLTYLKRTLQNSGAGGEAYRQELIQKIDHVL